MLTLNEIDEIFKATILILGALTPVIILGVMIFDSIVEDRQNKRLEIKRSQEPKEHKKPYVNEKLQESLRIEAEYQSYKLKYGAKA